MVFQDVVRTGVRVRSQAVVRYRILAGTRLWCVFVVAGVVAYITACGYVYNLSRERHRLFIQREALRKEYYLLLSQYETLRDPVRIQKRAQAFGMVPLTRPQAVASAPVVLAQRH
jgi:cell division protein FtsL